MDKEDELGGSRFGSGGDARGQRDGADGVDDDFNLHGLF